MPVSYYYLALAAVRGNRRWCGATPDAQRLMEQERSYRSKDLSLWCQRGSHLHPRIFLPCRMVCRHIPVCQRLIFLSDTPAVQQKGARMKGSLMTALPPCET